MLLKLISLNDRKLFQLHGSSLCPTPHFIIISECKDKKAMKNQYKTAHCNCTLLKVF